MRKLSFIALFLCITVMTIGCTSRQVKESSARVSGTKVEKPPGLTFAKDNNFVVLITQTGDSLSSLAQQYLGDASKAWQIAEFNNIDSIIPSREIVIPLKPTNYTGITVDGYQTIPILCYHRFGNRHTKLAVSEKNFRQQMQYLKDHNFHVVRMSDIADFLTAERQLPKKSVVITVDDGYRSTYDVAFPILKEFNFPATVFLYTAFTGATDALTWPQAKEMVNSGLIDMQNHSETHPNMALKKVGESESDYKKRIYTEIDTPATKITRHIDIPMHTFAYPYGDTNPLIIDHLKKNNYQLGVTVQPGSNATFSYPYMLQRTMIFGDDSIDDFKKALVVFQG